MYIRRKKILGKTFILLESLRFQYNRKYTKNIDFVMKKHKKFIKLSEDNFRGGGGESIDISK